MTPLIFFYLEFKKQYLLNILKQNLVINYIFYFCQLTMEETIVTSPNNDGRILKL